MKVNMTPNPLDVVTIHASQGDTEARQWEFELHNNGELIDTSDVTEQLFFKAYKGGTEQLLPENTSTPTTSPFKGDIKYPQGLLTDQEFTYRESPTESDGLAKITDIKGNTLVWNQLAEPLESGNYVANNGTVTYNNGVATYTASSAGASRGLFQRPAYRHAIIGHKYLISALITSGNSSTLKFGFIDTPNQTIAPNTKQRITKIATVSYTGSLLLYFTFSEVGTFSVENLMMIDLTQMGLDITDPSDFTSLFPLSYYSYNQGSLLSFMGNGIKTVGKNLFDETKYQNLRSTYDYYDSGYYCRTIQLLPNTQYTISQRATATSSVVLLLNKYSHVNESGFFDCRKTGDTKTYVTDSSGCLYIGIYANNTNAEANQRLAECQIQIEHGSTATAYEPYTSSTLSLPISTYFPSGMKSAGNVYDELTPSKAITRIGEVDVPISSSSWAIHGTDRFYLNGWLPNNIATDKNANLENNKGLAVQDLSNEYGSYMWFGYNGLYLNRISSTETIAEMQTRLSGLKLFYELATPTETSFTTASLVTENAEIPLSNEDGTLIGKCTEELSENPGFIDAKIKLTDSDGECYSNKIQLHIERSPQ